jgi:hypothetical protein
MIAGQANYNCHANREKSEKKGRAARKSHKSRMSGRFEPDNCDARLHTFFAATFSPPGGRCFLPRKQRVK